jgi:hypothetical protein
MPGIGQVKASPSSGGAARPGSGGAPVLFCGRPGTGCPHSVTGIGFGTQLAAGVREPAPRATTWVPFLQGRPGEDAVVGRELSVRRWGMIPIFAEAL